LAEDDAEQRAGGQLAERGQARCAAVDADVTVAEGILPGVEIDDRLDRRALGQVGQNAVDLRRLVEHLADAVQALLDDPATADLVLSNPHIGEVPLDRAIDQFYTSDVFMHTWDLARATGQDDRLDPEFCAQLLAGMEPMEAVIRSSGQYGPKVPVQDDADAQTKMLAFIGRDPRWTPAN
jgi:uncharacterized protein (TIGR03086 family)